MVIIFVVQTVRLDPNLVNIGAQREGFLEGAELRVLWLVLVKEMPKYRLYFFPKLYRDVPIDESVGLEVVVVLSERINDGFDHLHPAHVEDELQCGHDGEIHIDLKNLNCYAAY